MHLQQIRALALADALLLSATAAAVSSSGRRLNCSTRKSTRYFASKCSQVSRISASLAPCPWADVKEQSGRIARDHDPVPREVAGNERLKNSSTSRLRPRRSVVQRCRTPAPAGAKRHATRHVEERSAARTYHTRQPSPRAEEAPELVQRRDVALADSERILEVDRDVSARTREHPGREHLAVPLSLEQHLVALGEHRQVARPTGTVEQRATRRVVRAAAASPEIRVPRSAGKALRDGFGVAVATWRQSSRANFTTRFGSVSAVTSWRTTSTARETCQAATSPGRSGHRHPWPSANERLAQLDPPAKRACGRAELVLLVANRGVVERGGARPPNE